MNLIFKLAWRNIWRNKKRSLITIASVFIAVFLAVFTRSMQLGMYGNMINNVVKTYSGFIQIHKKGYWDEQTLNNAFEYRESLIDSLKEIEGVVDVIPRLQTFSLMSSGHLTKGVMIQGVDIEKEKSLVSWDDRIVSGKLFDNNDNSIIVAEGLAKYFNKKVGDTLVFIGQGYHGMSASGKFPIGGIINMKNPKLNKLLVFAPLKLAQEYNSAEGLVTHLIINKDDNVDNDLIYKKIKKQLNLDNYEVMTWEKMIPELKETIQVDSIGGILMIAILYMIISFGILGTVLMMTEERMYELGVMLAVGTKKIKLKTMLVVESIILSLLGVFIGIILVLPIVYHYHYNPFVIPGTKGQALQNFGFEPVIPMSIDWSIFLTHAMIIFAIALVAAIYPVLKISFMNPVKAMRAK